MEAAPLIDPAFWASDRAAAPGSGFVVPDLPGMPPGLVFFQTSGSTGKPRWIGLSREALLRSAAVVNAHLAVDRRSCWGLALPVRHVGGFGVIARAHESGGGMATWHETWDPLPFTTWLGKEGVTHLPLVPTQVHDLVGAARQAPASLEVVVVGGGVLDEATGQAARELGWPVLASYGMTEAGSQIATQGLDLRHEPYQSSPLEVLPHCEVRTAKSGVISVRGDSLFSGHLEETPEGWEFERRAGDWFETSDIGRLADGKLVVQGRVDALVKVLGELVDPEALGRELGLAVVALPDPRREHRLLAVCERDQNEVEAGITLATHNRRAIGYLRIDGLVVVDSIPRSGLGKIRRAELTKIVASRAI